MSPELIGEPLHGLNKQRQMFDELFKLQR
jgi:hypothetical protein